MLLSGPVFLNSSLSFQFFFLFILRLTSQPLLTSCKSWLGKSVEEAGDLREGSFYISCVLLSSGEPVKTFGSTLQGHASDNLLFQISQLHGPQLGSLILPPQLSTSFCLYCISSARSLSHFPVSLSFYRMWCEALFTCTLMPLSAGGLPSPRRLVPKPRSSL